MLWVCSQQPCCQAWLEGFFGTPQDPWPGPGRPQLARSSQQFHQLQQNSTAHQFADRKLNLVRKELQILNDSRLKRHKGRQINQLMCLWAKKLGCLRESRQVKAQHTWLPQSNGHFPFGFKQTPEIKSKHLQAGEFHQNNPAANYLL